MRSTCSAVVGVDVVFVDVEVVGGVVVAAVGVGVVFVDVVAVGGVVVVGVDVVFVDVEVVGGVVVAAVGVDDVRDVDLPRRAPVYLTNPFNLRSLVLSLSFV